MQLIDAAKLSDKEIQIALTGVNYEEDIEMYKQSKMAFRKLFREQVVSHSTLGREDVNSVVEAHYTNYRGMFQSSRRKYRGRGGRSSLSNIINTYTDYKHGFKYNGRQNRKSGLQLKPPEPDGNPLTCHICNSIFHFAESNGRGCPESYENLQAAYEASVGKNRAEDANEVCKITQEEVLMHEVRYDCLLDSCCSANVMGKEWKYTFLRIC